MVPPLPDRRRIKPVSPSGGDSLHEVQEMSLRLKPHPSAKEKGGQFSILAQVTNFTKRLSREKRSGRLSEGRAISRSDKGIRSDADHTQRGPLKKGRSFPS